MSASTGLWAELKRRNVFRVAAAYAVAAWLMLQLADILLDNFGAPDWVFKSLLVFLAVGFIVALFLSWAFELTPEGVKRAAEVTPPPGEARPRKPIDGWIMAGLLVVIAVMVGERVWFADGGDQRPSAAPEAALERAAEPTATMTIPAVPEAELVRGIGVLPFTNLSPDPDNAFFAGGIHEEVLTRLSRIADLRVISRTSMERIALEGLGIPEIGRRLGVSHVLEGSVRRAGERVRVTVQLIEAASDEHLWAENYDRTLDDVFAIQSDIALAIADQLQVALNPQQQASLGERPTDNAAAYELFLRAVDEARVWRGAEGFRAIIGLLEPAVALDPDFLDARVRLVEAYGRMAWLGEDPGGEYAAKARAQLDEITRRWPDRPERRLAQGYFTYTVAEDYEKSLAEFRALEATWPNDARVGIYAAASLKWLGRTEDYLAAARRVLALDPENSVAHGEVLIALRQSARGEEAIEFAEQALRRFPGNRSIRSMYLISLMDVRGDSGPLLAAGSADDGVELGMPGLLAAARFSAGDVEGALELLEDAARRSPGPAATATWVQGLRLAGRDAEAEAPAREAFEQARAQLDNAPPEGPQRTATDLAHAAWIAALAGEHATSIRWEQMAGSLPTSPRSGQQQLDGLLANAARWRGDVDAAWARLQPHMESPMVFPRGRLLALKPYFDAMYGASAGYREFMAELEAPEPR
ncbi:MAG: tetratricopeptide repeat protein [Gammaproteobacteria bacterium]